MKGKGSLELAPEIKKQEDGELTIFLHIWYKTHTMVSDTSLGLLDRKSAKDHENAI